ncbi:MAG TPA: hypothetical protein PLX23_06670 [Candidatus Hydrogenedens sp.]|nr:hypothetical protein [Candidatus Hydrogenedens sp.]
MSILLPLILLMNFAESSDIENKDDPIDFAYAMYDNFDLIDSNQDDLITLQEAQSLIEGLDKETFLSFDIDGNGQLSKEELKSAIDDLKTCGTQLERGCSCAANRVQTWISDFITILFSMTILMFMGSSKK